MAIIDERNKDDVLSISYRYEVEQRGRFFGAILWIAFCRFVGGYDFEGVLSASLGGVLIWNLIMWVDARRQSKMITKIVYAKMLK